MVLRSHLLAAVQCGPYQRAENEYATELWPSVPPNSLVIVDKGFFGANIVVPLQTRDRHFLIRAKRITKWRVVEKLGRHDLIVEMDVSGYARSREETLART